MAKKSARGRTVVAEFWRETNQPSPTYPGQTEAVKERRALMSDNSILARTTIKIVDAAGAPRWREPLDLGWHKRGMLKADRTAEDFIRVYTEKLWTRETNPR